MFDGVPMVCLVFEFVKICILHQNICKKKILALRIFRTLTFEPWDQTLIREISNGIAAAGIGMQPNVDGKLIRMSLPLMTSEQREDYIKLLGRKLEAARVMVREARGDFRKTIQDAKNEKTISEDDFKRDEESLQKLTDEYVKKLEEVAKKKEVEIRG